jgi:hypothetical protein
MKKLIHYLILTLLLVACGAQAPPPAEPTSPVSIISSPTAVAFIPVVSTQAVSPTTPPTSTPTLIPS